VNQTQQTVPSRPVPVARRLHSVGAFGREQLPTRPRGASVTVLVGGLRAVNWQVARLEASSVVLVAVGSRLSATAHVTIRWRS
jgi:hypothetical protein